MEIEGEQTCDHNILILIKILIKNIRKKDRASKETLVWMEPVWEGLLGGRKSPSMLIGT